MKAALLNRGEEPIQKQKRNLEGYSSKNDIIQQKKRRMEGCQLNIKNAHERDDHITFIEDSHEYFIDGKKMRISVSAYVDMFMHPFDKERILNFMFKNAKIINGQKVIVDNPKARQKTKNVGAVRKTTLDAWEKTGTDGTYYHSIFEKFYLSFDSEEEYEAMTPEGKRDRLYEIDPSLKDLKHQCALANFMSADMKLKSEGWRIHRVEWRIYDEEQSIAGSIDAIFRRELMNSEPEFMIADWKMSPSSFTDAKGFQNYNKVCPFPLAHLPNNKMTRYSLQLNKYRSILRDKYGLNCTMCLIQLGPNSPLVIFHPVSSMEIEITTMDNTWENYRNAEDELLRWKKEGKLHSASHPSLYYPCYIAKSTMAMNDIRQKKEKENTHSQGTSPNSNTP